MALRTAVVAGATGLVGGHLVQSLLDDASYARVTTLVRRATGLHHEKLDEIVVDFDHIESAGDRLAVDVVYCCLGTTIKKAGSQEAFRRVDHDYPLALAKASLAAGARRFVIVTSIGADAKSAVFYTRVKGELEAALAALAFPDGVAIVRPSLLLGERAESRAAERLATIAMRGAGFLMVGGLKKYRAIDARAVARAMVHAGSERSSGVVFLEGEALFAAARA